METMEPKHDETRDELDTLDYECKSLYEKLAKDNKNKDV